MMNIKNKINETTEKQCAINHLLRVLDEIQIGMEIYD